MNGLGTSGLEGIVAQSDGAGVITPDSGRWLRMTKSAGNCAHPYGMSSDHVGGTIFPFVSGGSNHIEDVGHDEDGTIEALDIVNPAEVPIATSTRTTFAYTVVGDVTKDNVSHVGLVKTDLIEALLGEDTGITEAKDGLVELEKEITICNILTKVEFIQDGVAEAASRDIGPDLLTSWEGGTKVEGCDVQGEEIGGIRYYRIEERLDGFGFSYVASSRTRRSE